MIASGKSVNTVIDFINSGGGGSIVGNGNDGGAAPRRMFIAKVNSNCAGKGKYYGQMLDTDKATEPSVETDLTEEMLGFLSPGQDCILYNLEEVATGTHLLTEGGANPYALCYLVAFKDERPVAAILSILSSPC